MTRFETVLKNILFVAYLFISCNAYSQEVKTKDGVSIGTRKDFISDCTKGAKLKGKEIKGVEIKEYKYCACFCDNLIPNINSWDLEKALKENNIAGLLLDESLFTIFMDCLEDNVTLTNDYTFEKSENTDSHIMLAVKSCVKEILNDEEMMDDFWTQETAERYCDCAITKLLTKGYTYKDLQESEDENGAIYNEVVLPCVAELFDDQIAWEPENIYITSDIIGDNPQSNVLLIDNLGQGFKVKISIGGVQRYFLFDTGATDLIIDRDTERELLIEGVLKKDNYLGKSEYMLANKQKVTAQMVRVDNVRIGEYTVNNLIIGIIDEGSLLCGKSFLDKFKKWELDSKNRILILYK
ncbi:MAG: retropepsin-like aspartic protease [Bacteroidales bacterium]|nr:retropepsin-like aspartic protease [Bacteroidales bacterium]MDY0216262.1 retropepsin-like aspartic protease [Bacteroidales bacterium]